MLNFCTLFNSNYLSRGLALYNSLYNQLKEDFCLYIIAFDDECYSLLKSYEMKQAVIIPLQEFEDEKLLQIKSSRTAGEYCWTCTPSVIRYVINEYGLDMCTYLDADIYFLGNPKELIDEIQEDESVLLTEHGYAKEYIQDDTSGKYCVQFVTFKNTPDGMMALEWWRDRCIEWCFNRYEKGLFGDQKYLDDWTIRFKGVHVLKHIGGGVAPWNSIRFRFIRDEHGNIWVKDKENVIEKPLIFYHFHGLQWFDVDLVRLSKDAYSFEEKCIEYVYADYVNQLMYVNQQYGLLPKHNATIKARREEKKKVNRKNYFHKSLLYGMVAAPVVVFSYNRLSHIQKCLEHLQECTGAKETILYIFSDGGKTNEDWKNVNDVRVFLKEYQRKGKFKQIHICAQEKNLGLATSIISGVTNVLMKHGKVIVVEDDLLVSKDYLQYMNGALGFYCLDNKIGSIAGYTPDLKGLKRYSHDIYITKKAECWGWSTWLNRWRECDWEVKDYHEFKKSLIRRWEFDKLQRNISVMLDRQQSGKNNSWAVRWVYYLYKKGQYTVYPKISLVNNIGMDGTGEHCSITDVWNVELQEPCNREWHYERLKCNYMLQRETANWGHDSLANRVKRKVKKVIEK